MPDNTTMDLAEILDAIAKERDALWVHYLRFKDHPGLEQASTEVFHRHQQTDRIWHFINDGEWP